MGGISPIVLSWLALDRERARIKASKDAAARAQRQADGMRVRAQVLEAKAELERIETQINTDGVSS